MPVCFAIISKQEAGKKDENNLINRHDVRTVLYNIVVQIYYCLLLSFQFIIVRIFRGPISYYDFQSSFYSYYSSYHFSSSSSSSIIILIHTCTNRTRRKNK